MKTPTLSVLVCAVMILAGADARTYCSRNWMKSNGRCFYYVPIYMPWAAAEKYCQRLGAHLASVHNTYEYRSIQRLIMRNTHRSGNTWLGASDCQKEGIWQWSDGTPFNYRYYGTFDNRYHRQHCLQMNYGANRLWDDLECYKRRPSVCAKQAYKFFGKEA